jgi:hypothetical protein
MREIMRALAKQAFVEVDYETGGMRWDDEYGGRKKFLGGWQLWGRESAVVTVRLMHEYLVRTVHRVARERGTPTDEVFKEAMAGRVAERILDRHEQAMAAQAREARERQAAQAHPGSTSNALVIVLEDYAQTERDLNTDLRNSWAPGTTRAKREAREAEYAQRTREREEQRAALFAEGHAENVVDMVMSGISLERALALAEETPTTKEKSEREKRRAEKEEARWQERWQRQQQRAHKKYTSTSYREGRRAGETVGLDTQVDQKETRKLS